MVKRLLTLLLFVAGLASAQGIFEPRMIKQAGATDAQCLKWSDTNGVWEPGTCLSSGAGEDNTASNAGAGTFYWFYQKAGVDLQFYSFNVTDPVVVSGPTSSVLTFSVNAASANTVSYLVQRDGSGNFSAGTITAALTGNASTATALAADPSDCSATQYATGIAASGNLTCAQPASTDLSDASALVKNNAGNTWTTGAQDFGAATSLKVPTSAGAAPTTSGFIAYDSTANTFVGGVNTATKTFATTDGNVATATALAGNGSNCSAGEFPLGVNASGASESCTALPTTISGTSNEVDASASTGAVTLSISDTFDISGSTSTKPVKTGTTAPATCAVGELFFDTDATAGSNVFGCTATNTWTAQGGTTAGIYPTRAIMWHMNSLVTAGAALQFYLSTSQAFNTTSAQSTAADADAFTQSFMLAAGTYTFSVLGLTANNRGKIDWYIDDSLFSTGQDWYSASNTYNVVKTVASVTVTGSGRHTLKGIVNGKNASSSGYYVGFMSLSFIPSSDTSSTE
jgi:hypothetical protein